MQNKAPIAITLTTAIRVNSLAELLCNSTGLGDQVGHMIANQAAESAATITERKTAIGVARGRVAALIAELERADAILSAERGAIEAQEHGDLYDS